MADGEPVLIFASGAHRVDTRARRRQPGLGGAAPGEPGRGARRDRSADRGVAPVGHPASLAALIDTALVGYETIWASAGTPNSVFATTFAELAASPALQRSW